jgi:hypothetical protein
VVPTTAFDDQHSHHSCRIAGQRPAPDGPVQRRSRHGYTERTDESDSPQCLSVSTNASMSVGRNRSMVIAPNGAFGPENVGAQCDSLGYVSIDPDDLYALAVGVAAAQWGRSDRSPGRSDRRPAVR